MYNKVTFCILYTAYSLHSLLPFACLKIVNDAKYMYHKNTILKFKHPLKEEYSAFLDILK